METKLFDISIAVILCRTRSVDNRIKFTINLIAVRLKENISSCKTSLEKEHLGKFLRDVYLRNQSLKLLLLWLLKNFQVRIATFKLDKEFSKVLIQFELFFQYAIQASQILSDLLRQSEIITLVFMLPYKLVISIQM